MQEIILGIEFAIDPYHWQVTVKTFLASGKTVNVPIISFGRKVF
jgi:hypothetical protein